MPFTPYTQLHTSQHSPLRKPEEEISPQEPGKMPLIDRVVQSGVSKGIQSFFPGAKLGEAVGTSIASIQSRLRGDDPEATRAIDASQPSKREVIGDTISAMLAPASLAMPLPKAATVVGSVLKGATQTGVLAGASGGAKSASEDNTYKQIARDAFESSLTGAVVGGFAGGVSKVLSKFQDRSPEALYNNAMKVSQRIKTANKSPAEFLKDEKVWGGLGSIQRAAQEGQKAESLAIAQKITERVSQKGDVITKYDDAKIKTVEKLSKSLGDLYSKTEIEQLVDSVPVAKLRGSIDGLGLEELNSTRSKLGSLLGDSKWLQQNPTNNTKAVQALYGVLSETIKSNTGTAENFARSSKWLETMKITKQAIDKADSKYGIGLYDILSGTGGAVLGYGSGDSMGEKVKNAVVGGVGGLAIERGLNSPAVKTGLAQAIENIPVDSAGKISRASVIELISTLLSGDTNQQTTQQEVQ